MRLEWLEALVKDVETDISSSQDEEELGFVWLFHALLVLFHEEPEFAWRYHQFNGVGEVVATEFPAHSSAIFLSLSLYLSIFPSFSPFYWWNIMDLARVGYIPLSLSLFVSLLLWEWEFMEGITPF